MCDVTLLFRLSVLTHVPFRPFLFIFVFLFVPSPTYQPGADVTGCRHGYSDVAVSLSGR
jgi:hypothetical protein